MKTTKKSIIALLTGAMILAGCSNNETIDDIDKQTTSLKPMTFTASMEGQGDATRAAIDGLDIEWMDGDQISVFDGASENYGNQQFTLTSGAGTTSGNFSGTAATASIYYALYPYAATSIETRSMTLEEVAEATGVDAEKLMDWYTFCKMGMESMVRQEMEMYGISPENQAIIWKFLRNEPIDVMSGVQRNASNQFEEVVLPAEQTVAVGQYVDPKAMLMIAKSTDASAMDFKNICAYVKVTPLFDCTAICLRSTDATKHLAGTLTIDYNNGAPTTEVTANGNNEVLLTGTITSGNAYYIAVRPEAVTSGFTIEFLTADKTHYYARTSSRNLGLARNKVTNLGEFATTGTPWSFNTPTSGTADGHDWKLVAPNLKIATEIAGELGMGRTPADWGGNWVRPSKEDIQPLIDAKALSSPDGSGIRFSPTGVFKYNSLDVEMDFPAFWLADTEGGAPYYVFVGNNYIKLSFTPLTTSIYPILYKYTGE